MAVYKAEHDGFHVTEPNTELDTVTRQWRVMYKYIQSCQPFTRLKRHEIQC